MNVRRNLRVRDISGLIESRLWAQILVAMVVGVGLGLLLSPQTLDAGSSPALSQPLLRLFNCSRPCVGAACVVACCSCGCHHCRRQHLLVF